MGEDLGRIEKPSVESFGEERKLFVVSLLFRSDEAPVEYLEKFEAYWQQVGEHIANLEGSLGRIQRVYHESIAAGGEEGLGFLEKLNPSSFAIARQKCLEGAQLEATDDGELVEESMDWERCLMLGFISDKVARMISDFYIEASRRRYEHISRRIDETLKASERAILFVSERHRLQFPKDTQIFSISPPALDQIHRWLRERLETKPDQ